MSHFELYRTVTDQIVAMLRDGVVPWLSQESQLRQAVPRR
jgi:antirestriction protein ArdC